MKYFLLLTVVVSGLLSNGCSHDPVYPSIGSLYISSNPVGAEIIIDGKTTYRLTPAKIDGLEIGFHQVTLKYYACKKWTQSVEIKPGQTKMLAATLQRIDPAVIQQYDFGRAVNPGDMAHIPEARKIVVSLTNVNYLAVLSLGDSTILGSSQIDVGSPQRAMDANFYADRIYVWLDNYRIASIGLTSGLVEKTFVFGSLLDIKDITFSCDGLKAYFANAADSSIFIIDALSDSIVKTIKLNGVPSEVRGGVTGNYLYVIFKENKLLTKIDINTGEVLASAVTGNDPMGLFWGDDYQTICLCNSTDRTILLVEANNFVVAHSPIFYYGEIIPEAQFSPNGSHLWVLESYITQLGETPPTPGKLGLLYRPTWQFVGHYSIGMWPTKIAQTHDGKYLYILEEWSKDILVVRTDVMD